MLLGLGHGPPAVAEQLAEPIVAVGEVLLVGWLVGALEGAVVVGGLSALGAGLYSIGIPTDSIVEYETALKADKFLVMAHGTADEVATATRILETTGAASIGTLSMTRGLP